jgi:hypothetical protein
MNDSLHSDDVPTIRIVPPKKVLRMRWAIMRGDGSGLATKRLYSAVQARRFERLARRFKLDVYPEPFGMVWVPVVVWCPDCGGPHTTTRLEHHEFEYGAEPSVTLSAEIEVHSCADCNFVFSAEHAEKAIDEAITNYRKTL